MASRSLGSLTLSLILQYGGFEKGLDKSARAADKRMKEIEGRAKKFGAALGGALAAGAGIAAAGISLYIKNTIEAEKVQAQLAARIKDTAGIAGRSLDQLNEQAERLQKLTVFDDEAIGEAQAALLVFKEVRGLQFDKTIESATDLATVMGTDVANAARILGKALSDPAAAFGALRRSGITFTEAQQEAIKKMVEVGNVAGAQDAILRQLETTMGTAAEAARNTLGGALQGLQNAFDNLLEGNTSGDGVRGTVQAINSLTETLNDPQLKRGVDTLAEGLLSAANAALQAIAQLGNFISEYRRFLANQGFVAGDEIAQLEARRDKLVKFRSTLRGELFNEFGDRVVDRQIVEADKKIAELERLSKWGNVISGSGTTEEARATGIPKPPKSKKAGKSDAEKEAEQLKAAYDRMNESLAEQIALFGLTGEAARVRYEIEHGALQKLSETQKQTLTEQAEWLDWMNEMADIESAWAGVSEEATSRTLDNMRRMQEEADRTKAAFVDAFRFEGANAIADFVTGAKSATDAAKDFFDNLGRMVTQMIAERWMEQLFGGIGTTGEGTTGGNWIGNLFGALFGGGKASGGPVSAGMFYRVNENGPEMLSVSGKDYLMMGNKSGMVTPRHALAGGATLSQTFVVQGTPDNRTREQMARMSGREAARGMSRTGR